ncbi:MAG: hypothetical protein ACYC3I_00095 [Gemmataceae bacterium]
MDTYEESFVIEKPHRPWWRRWLKRLGKILLVGTIAIVIRQAWFHHEVTKNLEETLAEMDRVEPGWRLEEIEAAREKIPEEENSARVVVAAARLLPKDWPPKEFSDLFVHLDPEHQLTPEEFAKLKHELESVRPALEEARKLNEMPRGRHRIIYERNVLDTRLNDQGETRRIAILLGYDALRYDQIGDGARALTSCRSILNAARALGDEPITISQLIRCACVVISCQAIERVLAQTETPMDELTSLQRALAKEDDHPDLLIIMRGERAMSHALFTAIEKGDVPVIGLAGVQWDWPDSALVSIWRMDTHGDHALMLSLLTHRIAEIRLPMHEQIGLERHFEHEVHNLPNNALLTRLLMPAMSKRGESSRRTHTYIRCTIVALAAERYRQKHKKWPDSLDKLCPQFLSAVPLDPFDGKPLLSRCVENGIVIYSVGSDGVDNNGKLDREHPNQSGADLGIRLWDVSKRRQPPRPKPPHEAQRG